MNESLLIEAEKEAKRFLTKCKELKERRSKGDLYSFQGCKESGAVKRASLDLSRALSAIRKPNQ